MFYKKVTCYLHRKTWPRRQAPSGSGRYHSHDPVALSGVLTNDQIPISLPVAAFSLKAMSIDQDPQLWPTILLLTFAGLRAKL